MDSYSSVNAAFVDLCGKLLKDGKKVSPRGMETLEIHPAMFVIEKPTDAMVVHPLRKMNYSFMCMEPIWILSGDDEPWIISHLKGLQRYTNEVDGKTRLMGAYGPRIRHRFGVDQLKYVVDTLKRDPDSRQATVVIADPSTDTKGYKDVACTQWMQFLIRDGHLDLTVLMRSNDIWLGFCYDAFMFSFFLHIVASILHLPVGKYYHTANSFHAYSNDFSKLKAVSESPALVTDAMLPPPLSQVKYTTMDEVYSEAALGNMLSGGHAEIFNGGYVTELLNFVSRRTQTAQVLTTVIDQK